MKARSVVNSIILIFFFSYFVIGTHIVDNYSVTPDEELHRINGFISLKYIFSIFNIYDGYLLEFNNIPDLYDDWRKTYGVIFDLPFAVYETFYKTSLEEIFVLRHYINFLIFFISTIYFYKLIKSIFKDKILAALSVLILISTPRIFSHSFYNSKDILFLSLIIIAVYYSVNFLKKQKIKHLILSSIFCALATNVRVLAIYLPLLIMLFYFFFEKKKLKFFFPAYSLSYFLILYCIWPFLWGNPIENFLIVFKESVSYPNWWKFKTLYLGEYLNPENLPWHYFFIWFLITTPIAYIILLVSGIFIFLKDYINFFLMINFKKNILLWRKESELIYLFIFLCFFIPIFFVICLNSTLYNGWRHLYFVYPFLIFFIIFFLNFVKKKYKIIYFRSLIIIILLQFISNISFIYKSHPVENIYFNFLSKPFVKNNFSIDYWGLGNRKTIDFLLLENKNFTISTSSFTPLNHLKYIKREGLSYDEIIKFNGTQEIFKSVSDYIFTNYFYNDDPKNLQKYKIPEGYESYYKLIIDDIIVNEVFKK